MEWKSSSSMFVTINYTVLYHYFSLVFPRFQNLYLSILMWGILIMAKWDLHYSLHKDLVTGVSACMCKSTNYTTSYLIFFSLHVTSPIELNHVFLPIETLYLITLQIPPTLTICSNPTRGISISTSCIFIFTLVAYCWVLACSLYLCKRESMSTVGKVSSPLYFYTLFSLCSYSYIMQNGIFNHCMKCW